MINKEEIESILRKQIESNEKIGDHGSASGHMSNTFYELDNFSYDELEDGSVRIEYSYTTYVDTEFTYYPDNPPYEYKHKRIMKIDRNRKIISDEAHEN